MGTEFPPPLPDSRARTELYHPYPHALLLTHPVLLFFPAQHFQQQPKGEAAMKIVVELGRGWLYVRIGRRWLYVRLGQGELFWARGEGVRIDRAKPMQLKLRS
jgi:hypothetical protein